MRQSLLQKVSPQIVLIVFSLLFAASVITPAHAALSLESESYLKTNSIVQGANNSGDLMLSKEINRAELMKIVVKAASSTEPSAQDFNSCFPDVQNEWFARYICWAKDQGYIQGYDDGKFHPERSVTEAEALKIINNALSLGVDENTPNSRPWYEGYYNTAIKKNLVGQDSVSRLADPALRGDVFEQLTRGITISELQKDTFERGDTMKVMTNPPAIVPVSQETKDLLSIFSNTVDHGYQPMSGKGNTTVKVALAVADVRANITFTMNASSAVTGTKDTLNKMQLGISVHSDINVNAIGETLGFTLDAKGTLVVDASSSLYMRLDQFSLVNKDSSDTLKDTINEIQTQANEYTGKWYSMPFNEEMKAELKDVMSTTDRKEMLSKSMDAVNMYLEKYGDIITIQKENASYKGTDAEHYSITVNGDKIIKYAPMVISELSPEPINKYEIRKDIKEAAPFIRKFFENFSSELWATKDTHMLRATSFKLSPTSFILPAELSGGSAGSLMLELLGGEEYEYPASITIEIPTGAEDISQYASDF